MKRNFESKSIKNILGKLINPNKTINMFMFYAYDLDEYQNDLRGFYLDYNKDLPGKNFLDTNEISNALNKIL